MQFSTDKIYYDMQSLIGENEGDDTAVKYFIVTAHEFLSKRNLIKCWESYRGYDVKIEIPSDLKEKIFHLLGEMTLDEIRNVIKDSLDKVSYSFRWNFGGSTSQMGELAYELLHLNEGAGDVLYIPCSGVGYPLIPILENAQRNGIHFKEIICNDINREACYLQSLLVDIFNENDELIFIECVDMLKKPNIVYNKVALYGPLGIKLTGEKENDESCFVFKDIPFKSLINSEWMFVDKIISKYTADNFRAVVLVSGKALWESGSSEYRERIIESGYLEGVIELPTKSLVRNSVPAYLLVLSKSNKEVKFLDASQMIIKNKNRFGKREKISNLDLKLILDKYYDKSNRLSIDEAKKLKNLTPSIVNVKKNDYENATPLGEVAEVFAGNQYTLKNFEGMIRDRETGTSILTSNDITNYSINLDYLTHIEYEDYKLDKYCLRYGDVVITSKSSKVKIGVVDFEPKEKIIVTGGMIIVRPNQEKLNSTYLKIFLDSENGQNALKAIQKGSYIVSLNAKDLSEIKIPMISMDKQINIADKFNRRIANIIACKKELEDLEKSINNILNEEKED